MSEPLEEVDSFMTGKIAAVLPNAVVIKKPVPPERWKKAGRTEAEYVLKVPGRPSQVLGHFYKAAIRALYQIRDYEKAQRGTQAR